VQTVFLYEPDMKALSIKKSEIYRYLGYKNGMTVTDEVESLIDEILRNVLSGSVPKVCYKRFDVTIQDKVDFGFLRVKSKDLTTNLAGCSEAVIFAATIGIYTDRQIQKEAILSQARACIYQAVGATVIEAVCDDFNEWIKCEEQTKGNTLRPRYSPGYGDVSLEIQRDIFRELNCAKMAGITLTDSMLMIPEKSVTAIIGIRKNNE
jgi:hypothetical protein